jgi:RNA polymerase sigma-70 factor, ECF subfamily
MTSNELTTTSEHSDSASVDAAVLSGSRTGNRAAQQQLYELCYPQVNRLVVRLNGLQDAPDVIQQVFLQLFEKIHQFEGCSKFTTWLHRLTVNESLQYLRKRKRWKFQPLSEEPMNRDEPDSHSDEHKELLEQALSRVEPELRTIFLLREVEKLSYRQIAEVVNIPEGTVGSRLNRVRRELQQHLEDLGWER